jgi:hypothetical protein
VRSRSNAVRPIGLVARQLGREDLTGGLGRRATTILGDDSRPVECEVERAPYARTSSNGGTFTLRNKKFVPSVGLI